MFESFFFFLLSLAWDHIGVSKHYLIYSYKSHLNYLKLLLNFYLIGLKKVPFLDFLNFANINLCHLLPFSCYRTLWETFQNTTSHSNHFRISPNFSWILLSMVLTEELYLKFEILSSWFFFKHFQIHHCTVYETKNLQLSGHGTKRIEIWDSGVIGEYIIWNTFDLFRSFWVLQPVNMQDFLKCEFQNPKSWLYFTHTLYRCSLW